MICSFHKCNVCVEGQRCQVKISSGEIRHGCPTCNKTFIITSFTTVESIPTLTKKHFASLRKHVAQCCLFDEASVFDIIDPNTVDWDDI